MTTKRANWLFLTIILVHIGVVLLLLIPAFAGHEVTIGIAVNFMISEGILMVPTILFLLAFERETPRPFEAAAFHKVKISTLLMIVLCTLLIMPLVCVCNVLTMFFTDNAVASLQGDILDMPFPVMLFMIGIFGPFCEEFVFRGVIYRSYRREDKEADDNLRPNGVRGGGIRAILLSALLFGLMHMNFNQALYAFVIGIFLAFLVEAAGSLWASVFCHMFFNSIEVVLMYASDHILNSVYFQGADEMAAELTTQSLLAALSVYLVIASVATPIAVCIIVWIVKNEGRQEAMATLLSGRRKTQSEGRGYLLSVPLIVAIVLCLGFMSLELFL